MTFFIMNKSQNWIPPLSPKSFQGKCCEKSKSLDLSCLFKLYFQGARRLKLRNIPECAVMSGGQAIEHLAAKGDPHVFEFPTPMWKYKDCTFSFSGLKNSLLKLIQRLEKEYGKCSKWFFVHKLVPQFNGPSSNRSQKQWIKSGAVDSVFFNLKVPLFADGVVATLA